MQVFDGVTVAARVRDIGSVSGTYTPVDGDKVGVFALPYYHGPARFVQIAPKTIRTARTSISRGSAVILRIPSLLATLAESTLLHRRQPYGVEVVGDPCEVFAPGGVKHPLRPLLRWWFTRAQKRQCRKASGAAYVTQHVLQSRYPCEAFQTSISDVEISESALINRARVFQTYSSGAELSRAASSTGAQQAAAVAPGTRLILVGSLEQYYKAPDIVIAALAQLVGVGYNLELVVVGDGKYRKDLQALAQGLGVNDRVFFRGMLPAGEAVRAELDAADLFLLPSRTEGLPAR